MVNYAILTDYNDKFVGAISQDIGSGKIYYKVINKFLDNLLESLFSTSQYRETEDNEFEYLDEIQKTDPDYLETALTSLEGYKVKEFYENENANYRQVVIDKFQGLTQKS